MDKQVRQNFELATTSSHVKRILNMMADTYDEQARNLIYKTYNDIELNNIYQSIRDKNDIQMMHSKGMVHRELLRFPNQYIMDFVVNQLTPIYGEGWLKDKKLLKKACKNEPILKPWVLYSKKKI
jgi:hypothetical protein